MSFFRIVALVIILAIIGFFIAWVQAPRLIARNLSEKMEVEVTIRDIDLSFNKIEVHGIQIANPEGSYLPKALTAENVSVRAPLTNYLKEKIVIDEMELDNLYFSIEIPTPTALTGNWGEILGKLAPAEKKEGGILIKKLVLTNLNADLVYRLQGNTVKKIPPITRIELTNVSSDGVGLDQIIVLVLDQGVKVTLQSPKSSLDFLKQ